MAKKKQLTTTTAAAKTTVAAVTLPLPARFEDLKQNGDPRPTLHNTRIALNKLKATYGMKFSYDEFRNRRYIDGNNMIDVNGEVNDDMITALIIILRNEFRFETSTKFMRDAVSLFCREHSFHPILDYLATLQWDGVPRLETWIIKHCGAKDTPFVRAVSKIILVASVRRVRRPGAKFDYMVVLEGPEGYNKSTLISMLYGAENFSDTSFIGLRDKELQEAITGKWAMEAADLSGMKRAEVEHVKAQLSRGTDRTRPAYGWAVVEAPRCCVFWGTTNDTEYLQSQTGNRRFLPIAVGRIDLDAIAAIRDQLWAEAAMCEALDEDILLPEKLWAEATAEQDARTIRDPWINKLRNVHTHATGTKFYEVLKNGEERIASDWIATEFLNLETHQITTPVSRRIAQCMRYLGWQTKDMRIHKEHTRGFYRNMMEAFVEMPVHFEFDPENDHDVEVTGEQ